VALIDELPAGSRIAFDTSALIYYIEEHPAFAGVVDPVFEAVGRGVYSSVVSVISLLETVVGPIRGGRSDLAGQYRRLLTNTEGITLSPVAESIAEAAATIRAVNNLQVADALIAATALIEGCSHLIANDAKFGAVPNFRTLVISDFAP
jgi:predicted nucleic acid-binding protein